MSGGLVGITGTRTEPTAVQAAMLGVQLQRCLTLGATDLAHGDATGFDALAHDVAMLLGYTVHVRPPELSTYRAFRRGHHNYRAASYMTRNRTIAAHCTWLIAGVLRPESDPEMARSGTWATVRMARRLGKPVTLIWPDGRVEADRGGVDDDQGDGHRDVGQGHQDLDAGAVAGQGGGHRQ